MYILCILYIGSLQKELKKSCRMKFQLEMKKPHVLILGKCQGGEVLALMLCGGRVSESGGLSSIRKDALGDPTSCGRS